jgi:membrane protease YdiL (CAAX protease family)
MISVYGFCRALGVSGLVYVLVYLVVSELVYLASRGTISWSVFVLLSVIAMILLVVVAKRIGCSYAIAQSSKSTSKILLYVVSASAACVLVAWLQSVGTGIGIGPLAIRIHGESRVILAYAVTAPLLAAVLEEVTFRGILQSQLDVIVGRCASTCIVVALFLGAHLWTGPVIVRVPFLLFVAVFTGAIAAKSRSLMPGICVHLLVNGTLAIGPAIVGTIDPIARSIHSVLAISMAAAGFAVVAFVSYRGVSEHGGHAHE